jgi:D-3-phosphoglycerate dehydrogenase
VNQTKPELGIPIDSNQTQNALAKSDFVSVHAPLTPQTTGMLNAGAFRAMKKTASVINTARGPLINEADLIAALDADEIAGAALDVVETEPFAPDSPLLGRDHVILSPHTAFYSVEALEELQTKAASDVARVLSGEPPVYPVPGG